MPPAPRKRVLLAWEFGAGRTHVLDLLGVARHLRNAGVDCLAALLEPGFQRDFAAVGIPVVQTYIWPGHRGAARSWEFRATHGMGDHLANLGFAHGPSVAAAIAHYDGLFSLFPPDLVICDCAFGAFLAARERCPVIAVGSAATLPPVYEGSFAPSRPEQPNPTWPPDEVCAGINAGLALTGRFPIASLADLLAFDGTFPFGPAALDPFSSYRTEPVLPPNLPGFTKPGPSAPRNEVFVYLHGLGARTDALVTGLEEIGRPTRAYLPDISAEKRRHLLDRGILVEEQPLPLDELLSRTRCLVHLGGGQMTMTCLAAGIPQIILAKQRDHEVAAALVAQRGLGAGTRLSEATPSWLTEEIRRAYDDDRLTAACQAAAPEFRAQIGTDPTRIAAEAAAALLGISLPG